MRVQVARTLRKGAAGAAKSHKGLLDRVSGFRMRTLGQLAHWATLMAGAGLLLVLLLQSTRSDAPVASFSDYLQVGHSDAGCERRCCCTGQPVHAGCSLLRAAHAAVLCQLDPSPYHCIGGRDIMGRLISSCPCVPLPQSLCTCVLKCGVCAMPGHPQLARAAHQLLRHGLRLQLHDSGALRFFQPPLEPFLLTFYPCDAALLLVFSSTAGPDIYSIVANWL